MQGTHKSKKSSKYRCLKISNFSFVIDEKKKVHRLLRHTLFCVLLSLLFDDTFAEGCQQEEEVMDLSFELQTFVGIAHHHTLAAQFDQLG